MRQTPQFFALFAEKKCLLPEPQIVVIVSQDLEMAKTWGDIFHKWLRKGVDAAYAAWMAERWARRKRPETITDGCTTWINQCQDCGGELQVVRPGKVQCPRCG